MRTKAFTLLIVLIYSTGCSNQSSNDSDQSNNSTPTTLNTNPMQSLITIVEIPSTNLSSSITFYESILDIKISEMEMEGNKMGMFPGDGLPVAGVLIQGEGYTPSSDGVVIYLNGGDNLQVILDKIEPNGGKVLVPKTLIDEEMGYFAIFLDSEGNRLGLHSPK